MSNRVKALAVISFCLAGFITLALGHDALAGFDRDVMLALRQADDLSDPIGPPWLEEAARDLTALGGVALLTLATTGVVAALLANAKPRLALFAIAAVGGAQMVSETFKAFIARARPDLVPHEVAVYSASFPSGHALVATAAYFTLAFILARAFGRRRNRAMLYSIAAAISLLVGVSRIYLGVHWPTDVIAGWLGGIAWAIAAAWAYRALITSKASASTQQTD